MATKAWEEGDESTAKQLVDDLFEIRSTIKNSIIPAALGERNKENYEFAREKLHGSIKLAGGGALIGELMHHLGTVEQGAKNFEDALKYLRAAVWIRTDAGDTLGAAYSAFQIPMCLRVSGIPDDLLLEDFRAARDAIYVVIDGPHAISDEHMGNMLQNLAFCLQVERDFVEAIKRYSEVLAYRDKANDRRGAAMTLARKAECQIEIGQIDNAHDNSMAALKIFQEIGDVNRIKQVEETLQKISTAGQENDGKEAE